MDLGGTHIDPQQLIEVGSVVGGLLVTSLFGFLLVRRARAARLRQIEGAEGAPPSKPRRVEGRGKLSELTEEEPEPQEEPQEEPEEEAPESETPPKPAPREVTPAVPVERRQRPAPEATEPAKPAPAEPRPKPAASPVPAPIEEVAPAKKKKDAAALAPGLARTRSGWVARLGDLFKGKRELDAALMDEVEKVLLTADIGVRTSQKLLEEMRTSLSRKELGDADSAWAFLRRRTSELLAWDTKPVDWSAGSPFVLLVIGVNGSGKTTTIGKLAAKLIADGKKVLVGAGDTFRAAAAEQLEIWSNRVGATLVRGKEGADPSSVLFDAVKKARAEQFDVVIADTAGRLHTKTDLMEELQKVRRVIGKAAEGAPHETWLVIDSTSGQNAIAQAQIFTQAMAVSGIVLTKLDGTAKGGVILGIADQLRIPVRFIGIGERVDDLREFDADEFVEALYAQ
jgi:fused signal recognition particle receptor